MRSNGGAADKHAEQQGASDLDEPVGIVRDPSQAGGGRLRATSGQQSEHLIFFDEILQAVLRRSCGMTLTQGGVGGDLLDAPISPNCTMRSTGSFAVEDITETMILTRTLRDVLRGTPVEGEDVPVEDEGGAIHGEDEGGGGYGGGPGSPHGVVAADSAAAVAEAAAAEAAVAESRSGLHLTLQDLEATIMASTLRELEQDGPLWNMSRNAQATLLGSTLFEYGGSSDDDERSLFDWATQSSISAQDGETRYEGAAAVEELQAVLQATASFRTTASSGLLLEGAEPTSQLEATTDLLGSPPRQQPAPLVAPAGAGARRVHPGRMSPSDSFSDTAMDSTRTMSPSNFDTTLRGMNDERPVMSLTARIADALLTEAITPEGNLDAGVVELLQRLAVDGAALDQSLAGSIRHVRQLGAVLAGERLSSEEIQALPRIRFRDAQQQCCAICLDSYQQGEFLTRLPCSHAFHVDCIADWLRRASRCPLCRAQCTS